MGPGKLGLIVGLLGGVLFILISLAPVIMDLIDGVYDKYNMMFRDF